MDNSIREQMKISLLENPEKLLYKKPFTRGCSDSGLRSFRNKDKVEINEKVRACHPKLRRYVVTQEQFATELDPHSHKVLYDENIPSITMKLQDGTYADIEYKKMAVPFQRNILNKQVLHLCGNKMQFTLMNTEPTEKQTENFITFKQYWDLRNQDGMKTKLVAAQKSFGDAGLLYYFDHKNRIKSRLISYDDGYTIISHNDNDGERLLECIYYSTDEGDVIEVYDEKKHYTFKNFDGESWQRTEEYHGFDEIPLITKRGNVAWDNVQDIIEVYEIIYNIFLVIQKRHGWGILYIKGKFKDNAQKIAGSIILNDTNVTSDGKAQYLTPPSPQNMIETLEAMRDTIQTGSSTTFLLPKDIKSNGDISAQAIMLTQSFDIENALQGVIEYQNVADKMARLFKYGLSKELVKNGINETAVTDFEDLMINAKFKVWRPKNDTDYNSMLIQLAGAGLISKETGIEKNTESSPDEKIRVKKESENSVANQNKSLDLQNENNSNEQEQNDEL